MNKLIFVLILFTSVNFFSQHIENTCATKNSEVIKNYANPNTSNYDITYHRLQLDVNPDNTTAYISGTITTFWNALSLMNSITFDLKSNMSVTSVVQRGANLNFTQQNNEVSITLPSVQNTGVLDSLSVSYSGSPQSGDFGTFIRSTHSGGVPIIWTLSEPYGAMNWWPCKQDLTDKIDNGIDVIVTHPAFYNDTQQYKTASNGLVISETINNNVKTTHWRHSYPIPAYLVAFSVTNYAYYTDYAYPGTQQQIPILNYVYPDQLSNWQNNTPITEDLIEMYGDLFEMYPYADEKYGHAQCGFGGGMEHTTMTFLNSYNRQLITHELAHQWFGDKVTCGSWHDIWLNEGFASYCEGLTVENFDGIPAFNTWRAQRITSITNLSHGSVYCTDTTSVAQIFNQRLSYHKGAMVLHMLRYKLGDANFFQSIKNYLADPELAYSYAKTPDLQNHFEAQSGVDLDEFFADWVYGQGHPSYQLTWSQSDNTLFLTVYQSQSHTSVSFFEMPLPVKITGTGGETLWLRLENISNDQLFTENVNFIIAQVQFDPDFQLISQNNSVTLKNNSDYLNALIQIPNPVKETVEIIKPEHIRIKEYALFNENGQQVRFEKLKNEVLNFSHLTNGLYWLQLSTNKGLLYKKIIKE